MGSKKPLAPAPNVKAMRRTQGYKIGTKLPTISLPSLKASISVISNAPSFLVHSTGVSPMSLRMFGSSHQAQERMNEKLRQYSFLVITTHGTKQGWRPMRSVSCYVVLKPMLDELVDEIRSEANTPAVALL